MSFRGAGVSRGGTGGFLLGAGRILPCRTWLRNDKGAFFAQTEPLPNAVHLVGPCSQVERRTNACTLPGRGSQSLFLLTMLALDRSDSRIRRRPMVSRTLIFGSRRRL